MLMHLVNSVVEVKTLEAADRTIVPTRLLSLYLLQRYGKDSVVVPNCIDLDDFRPIDSKSSVLEELEIPYESNVIFFHGSPYRENIEALGRLTRIVERMNNRGVSSMAVIGGALPRVKSEFFRYLGYREDLRRYISAADVAILPVTITEMGMRSRVVEYLACGLPVVTSPSGATEVSEAIERGFVSLGRNENELTEAALKLLGLDNDKKRRLRSEARRFAERNFSFSRASSQLREVYRAVTRGGKT